MINKEHPMNAPLELIDQWLNNTRDNAIGVYLPSCEVLFADQAVRWGADQELEACLTEISFYSTQAIADKIRAARRPSPLSLKEQALATLESADGSEYPVISTTLTADQHALIRRALEALPD